MKILVAGNPEKAKNAITFTCPKCGCVFIADETDYVFHVDFRNESWYEVRCPTCGKLIQQDEH